MEKFKEVFKVPDFIGDNLNLFVTEAEMELVVLLQGEAKAADQVAVQMDLSLAAAEELLEQGFRRFILQRQEVEGKYYYQPLDFYTRLDKFAMFEDFSSLPKELRVALDQWCFQQYVQSIRPYVTALQAEAPSGIFHSPVVVEEAFKIIDIAAEIVL
ncbi:MAG: hypothetical protein SCK28_07335, partial [Bacillota bacterium]|nr:hypothetical protein [Bacillota bacterium]